MNVWIHHEETREFIYPLDRRTLLVKVKCKADEPCDVSIVYWNRFHHVIRKRSLESLCINGVSEHYRVKLTFTEPAKYLGYYFVIRGRRETRYYSPHGLSTDEPTKSFEYACTNEMDVFHVPSWAKGAVGYQIFPERFYNGEARNDPAGVEPWGGDPNRTNFFGGDLRGMIEKFHHLQELGIEIIYLTPIFHAPSNHKYDTIDYFKIDPSFGDLADLQELIRLCHAHDVKVVLDGVFHHIGYDSEQFQDALRNGKQSPYWDWFYVDGERIDPDAVNYECVGYYKWMPKLNFSNQAVRQYFIRVGEYWIREAGIDGWRLDVADEVDFTFWQQFRRAIKQVNPHALLLGETWKNGKDLLRGDQMDSIMNYRFRDAMINYFAERSISTQSFAHRVESILFDYPHATHHVLYNLLGSHDTARFLTVCQGDQKKLKLAVALQLTFPGMPFIYYGDEIGMTGETDPDCRKPMAWDTPDHELLKFYTAMIRLRQRNQALKYGDFMHVDTGCEVYGFIRMLEEQAVIVFMNNYREEQRLSVDLTAAAPLCAPCDKDQDHENPGSYFVRLPAYSCKIYRLEKEGDILKMASLATV